MVGGYLGMAEELGTWRWLDEGLSGSGKGKEGEGDEVLLTRFGEEIIGAVVVRGVRDVDVVGNGGGKGGKKQRQRSNSNSGSGSGSGKTKAVIRAWTVRQKYRGKGVGGALLEEAVRFSREKGWSGPVFAVDHANSGRVLPQIFNGGFDAREKRARRALESYVEEGYVGVGSGNGKGGKGRGRS